MNSGIYRIDLGNGWFYIGSSSHLSKRKNNHKGDLVRGNHSNMKMQNCWNKYKVFEFTVLEKCDKSELLLREQLLIDIHFSDSKNLNLTPTAGSCLGYVASAEHRAKNSAAQKGKVASAETRAKMSAAQKGKVLSAEHCAKISAAQKGRQGRIPSAETRAKMSTARKGVKKSDEQRQKMSAWQIGRVLSPETRAKISATKKLRREQMGK
jgi:group I intron endonuclease